MAWTSSSSSEDDTAGGGGLVEDVDLIELAGPDRLAPAVEHLAWRPEAAVKLRMGREWPENRQPVSLPTVFRR